MTILQVITSLNPKFGGVSKAVFTLGVEMKQFNIVTEVVCLDPPDSSYLRNEDLIIHALGSTNGFWRYNVHLKPWLKTNAGRFDVIIINGLWSYHSYAAWYAVNAAKKRSTGKFPRLLVMPHGMLDPYFQRAKDRRLKAVRNWIYWKLLERKVVNDADGLLFTCETELLLARKTFTPYHPRNEYNVGYGIVSPPAFHQAMSVAFSSHCPGLDEDGYLLFISRIHPKKGIDLLISAYIQLHKEFIAAKKKIPKLVIAGPGMNTRFGKGLMQQLDHAPEVKPHVVFSGMLDGDAKWGAFYGCEAFVLPSHQENFGIAVAEALACGKPVLISEEVNIWREIMTEGAGIIEKDSLTGVLKMLREWLNMPKEKHILMGDRARKAYQKHFTVSGVTQKLNDVIRN
ncbi:MAG: glycosyl transferase family 1 [Mucilaginibacter sp.]|nr:glycosyl transferase family 1 [Mucilaginibacter sp.]